MQFSQEKDKKKYFYLNKGPDLCSIHLKPGKILVPKGELTYYITGSVKKSSNEFILKGSTENNYVIDQNLKELDVHIKDEQCSFILARV